MELDLKEIRKSYGMSAKNFAALINMTQPFYLQYESRKEIPSKYAYIFWKKLDNFPLPQDFFHYTSFSLQVNMRYHHLTQKDAAAMFDISSQTTLSIYMKDNIPMYEKKEYFKKFDPFILPLKLDNNNMTEITDLTAKGNLIISEKKRLNKKKKMSGAS